MGSLLQYRKNYLKKLAYLCLLIGLIYGAERLYFKVTGGFHVAHISSDFTFDPRWETHSLSEEEKDQVDTILSRKFHYLGKGCQSYVFLSDDDQYVLKFFKYQRFRPQFYLHWFSFLPIVDNLLKKKIETKTHKRENLFSSWKVAFDHLQEQTGLVYVHLNKTTELNKEVTIYDKLGLEHTLNIDQMEFLIQKKAQMLCPTITERMQQGKTEEVKALLTKLFQTIVSEYQLGYADNDHALMQNTGVYKDVPIHIDVGQFVLNPEISDPTLYHQELFNKTWKFRIWLKNNYPELLVHLEHLMIEQMGNKFFELQFIPKER